MRELSALIVCLSFAPPLFPASPLLCSFFPFQPFPPHIFPPVPALPLSCPPTRSLPLPPGVFSSDPLLAYSRLPQYTSPLPLLIIRSLSSYRLCSPYSSPRPHILPLLAAAMASVECVQVLRRHLPPPPVTQLVLRSHSHKVLSNSACSRRLSGVPDSNVQRQWISERTYGFGNENESLGNRKYLIL